MTTATTTIGTIAETTGGVTTGAENNGAESSTIARWNAVGTGSAGMIAPCATAMKPTIGTIAADVKLCD